MKGPLSQVITLLNEHFGLGLGEPDRVLFEQIAVTVVHDPYLRVVAQENTKDNFMLAGSARLDGLIIERQRANLGLSNRFFRDQEFKNLLAEAILGFAYQQARQIQPPIPLAV